MVYEIASYQELEDLVQSLPKEKMVVLDCYAPWCGPCKALAPFLDSLSLEYIDVLFLKADVDKIEELTTEFLVSAMPTFIFLKDKAVIGKIEGANQAKLVTFIEENQ